MMKSASTGVYKDHDGIVMDIDLYNGTSTSTSLDKLEELFICNTCSFTYIFSDGPYSEDAEVKTVYFRESLNPVTMYFQKENLAMMDTEGDLHSFTMTIGLVPTEY